MPREDWEDLLYVAKLGSNRFMAFFQAEQVPKAKRGWEQSMYKATVILRDMHRKLKIPQPRQYKSRRRMDVPPVVGEENSPLYENVLDHVGDMIESNNGTIPEGE